MVTRREENMGGGLCLTALTDFASSDSSMTASSEAEGTISCGGSTVVAILVFRYFLGGRDRVGIRRRTVLCDLCHPRGVPVGDKARDFTMPGP